jgi:hypothetical protein
MQTLHYVCQPLRSFLTGAQYPRTLDEMRINEKQKAARDFTDFAVC